MEGNQTATPLDTSHLREVSDGDLEFAKELLDIFLEDAAMRIAELETAVAERNAERIRYHAHTMKSASGNVGAKIMQDLSLKLERIGANAQLDAAEEIFRSLSCEFDRVKEFVGDGVSL